MNQKFLNVCQAMNITVKTTTTNGMIEGRNLILRDMLHKQEKTTILTLTSLWNGVKMLKIPRGRCMDFDLFASPFSP